MVQRTHLLVRPPFFLNNVSYYLVMVGLPNQSSYIGAVYRWGSIGCRAEVNVASGHVTGVVSPSSWKSWQVSGKKTVVDSWAWECNSWPQTAIFGQIGSSLFTQGGSLEYFPLCLTAFQTLGVANGNRVMCSSLGSKVKVDIGRYCCAAAPISTPSDWLSLVVYLCCGTRPSSVSTFPGWAIIQFVTPLPVLVYRGPQCPAASTWLPALPSWLSGVEQQIRHTSCILYPVWFVTKKHIVIGVPVYCFLLVLTFVQSIDRCG